MQFKKNKKLSNFVIYHIIVMLVTCTIFSNIVLAAVVNTGTSFNDAITLDGNSAVKDKLTNDHSIVYYKVTLATAGRLDLNLRTFLNNEVKFVIYNSNQEQMLANTCAFNNSTQYGELITSNYYEAGVYYIKIEKMFLNGEGEVSLTSAFKKSVTKDIEPNNDITKAQNVPMQKSVTGLFTFTDKTDYYYIDTTNEENLTITITPKFDSMLAVTVLDKNGNKIETGTAKYEKATKYTKSYTYQMNEPKGRYYVAVQTYNTSNTGTYTVKASGLVKVKSLSLSLTKVSLNVGSSKTIKIFTVPTNATESYTFKSSNKSIAKVDKKGKITAVKPGKAAITVTSSSGVVKKCSVTVKKISVKKVYLNKSKLTLDIGDKYTLKKTISPQKATNKSVVWKSSNKSVVKVDQKGKVTALKKGTAKITVTTKDGSHKRTCVIKVVQPVTKVTLNKKSLSLYEGKTFQLKAKVKPSNASNKKVTYRSSNTNIVSVDSKGKIKAKKAGSAVITVTAVGGKKKATCKVTVKKVFVPVSTPQPTPTPTPEPNETPTQTKKPESTPKVIKVTSIYLSGCSLSVGESRKLSVIIKPSNATNKKLTYKSSNSKIATVSSSGVVKAISKGTVTITVTSSNGVSNFCSVVIR